MTKNERLTNEWLTADNAASLINSLPARPDARKLRLCLVACCRRFARLITDPDLREAVEVGERYADGRCTGRDRAAAERAAERAEERVRRDVMDGGAADPLAPISAHRLALGAVRPDRAFTPTDFLFYFECCVFAAGYRAAFSPEVQAGESAALSHTLREVYGNPFRPVAADPKWLTPTAVSLARAIYDARAFDRLPVLADALEEAGCDNHDILSHCRTGGPHVKGCWVLDTLLGM